MVIMSCAACGTTVRYFIGKVTVLIFIYIYNVGVSYLIG